MLSVWYQYFQISNFYSLNNLYPYVFLKSTQMLNYRDNYIEISHDDNIFINFFTLKNFFFYL